MYFQKFTLSTLQFFSAARCVCEAVADRTPEVGRDRKERKGYLSRSGSELIVLQERSFSARLCAAQSYRVEVGCTDGAFIIHNL